MFYMATMVITRIASEKRRSSAGEPQVGGHDWLESDPN